LSVRTHVRKVLGENGLDYVRSKYSWPGIIEKYRSICKELSST